MIQRKRNKVHGLFINDVWCTDVDVLLREALSYFRSLFRHEDGGFFGSLQSLLTPKLSAEACASLSKLISKAKVWSALLAMDSYKAPGLDGF